MTRAPKYQSGQKFNSWTLLNKSDKRGYWNCKCDCGFEKEVAVQTLKSNTSKSCRSCSSTKDLTDERFGRLTVIKKAPERGDYKGHSWLCECDCGNIKPVRSQSLIQGRTKSCGCWKSEVSVESGKRLGSSKHPRDAVKTHGMRYTKIYKVWCSMKGRCLNPNNKDYGRYGGRGITVCDRWLNFENFYADMGDPPEPNLELDRRDNDGNYDPSNCRWVDRSTQVKNSTLGRLITIEGVTKNLCDWAKEKNISSFVISNRISKGWSPEDAVLTPIIRRK